jgi:hypothetical protein
MRRLLELLDSGSSAPSKRPKGQLTNALSQHASVMRVGSVIELTLGSGGQACDDSCLHRFKP